MLIGSHSEAAIAQTSSLKSSEVLTPASLEKYSALQNYVAQVDEYCSSVEDASGQQKLHLVGFLEEVREKTWSDIKQTMSTCVDPYVLASLPDDMQRVVGRRGAAEVADGGGLGFGQ